MYQPCFVFVCQQGELEANACLLAASLRFFLGPDVELVAAIPSPKRSCKNPSQEALTFLADLNIRTETISNTMGADIADSNKVLAIGIPTQATHTVYLDSSILVTGSFEISEFTKASLMAKPTSLGTSNASAGGWENSYQKFGLSLPLRRVKTTVSEELQLPFFSLSVVAVKSGKLFSKAWLEVSKALYEDSKIINRPIVQSALPIAAALNSFAFECLGEDYNYPAHLKPTSECLPNLCCYQSPDVIRRDAKLNHVVFRIARRYPKLVAMLKASKPFSELLKPYRLELGKCNVLGPWLEPNAEKNLVITGLPRSGTSLLCRLLHGVDNSVVINEPTEVLDSLQNENKPFGLACYYQNARKQIRDNKEIENKVKDGEVIEDTAVVDQRSMYTPNVSDANFVLGTKTPLAYLFRISDISSVMPSATIVACIRHPYDTIASWKKTFDHLRLANVMAFPINQNHDKWLDGQLVTALKEIDVFESVVVKRALLWRALAEYLLRQSHLCNVLKYEDLVEAPAEEISKWFPKQLTERELKSLSQGVSLRRNLSGLDALDYQVIHDLCWPIAGQFGYEQGL